MQVGIVFIFCLQNMARSVPNEKSFSKDFCFQEDTSIGKKVTQGIGHSLEYLFVYSCNLLPEHPDKEVAILYG